MSIYIFFSPVVNLYFHFISFAQDVVQYYRVVVPDRTNPLYQRDPAPREEDWKDCNRRVELKKATFITSVSVVLLPACITAAAASLQQCQWVWFTHRHKNESSPLRVRVSFSAAAWCGHRTATNMTVEVFCGANEHVIHQAFFSSGQSNYNYWLETLTACLLLWVRIKFFENVVPILREKISLYWCPELLPLLNNNVASSHYV